MKLHKTRNDLTSYTKIIVAALLNARLADTIDLALMTKQAHWNLRGREFIAVHECSMPSVPRLMGMLILWRSALHSWVPPHSARPRQSLEVPNSRHTR